MGNKKQQIVSDYDRLIGNQGFTEITTLTVEMKTLIRAIQEITKTLIGSTVLSYNSGWITKSKDDANALDAVVYEMKKDLKKNRVLISVSSKSVDRVEPLKEYLETNGVSTFLYDGAIKSGQKFQDEIINTINDAELVICFIDENYLSSEFSMVECVYSFAANDISQYIWFDSSVKDSETPYYNLLKFITNSVQYSEIENKSAIVADLKQLKEFKDSDLMDSGKFNKVYDHLLGK